MGLHNRQVDPGARLQLHTDHRKRLPLARRGARKPREDDAAFPVPQPAGESVGCGGVAYGEEESGGVL